MRHCNITVVIIIIGTAIASLMVAAASSNSVSSVHKNRDGTNRGKGYNKNNKDDGNRTKVMVIKTTVIVLAVEMLI